MAAIVKIKFGDESFQFGNGASPEVFSEPCGITARSRNFAINTQSDEVWDCDNPDEVTFDSPYKVSQGESLDITFVATPTLEPLLVAKAYLDTPSNARWVINKAGRDGYYSGPGILTALSFSSERRGDVTGTFTWSWTAQPTWTAA